MGKSRLAAELAGQVQEMGDTQVHVVDVAQAEDASSLQQALFEPDDRCALLVLDNCEHLVADVAPLAEDLLSGSPNLSILATSRERLGVTGEVVRRVAPAQATDDDSPSHAGTTSAAGRYAAPDDAVAGSEALLAEPERRLLRRLSVFAGGFSLEAARQVCAGGTVQPGKVLHLLGRLVDKSLVEVHTTAGRSRYRLPFVVAEHAHARLAEAGEEDQLRSSHAAWYVSVVEAVPRVGIDRNRHTAWVNGMEMDHEDLRAALRWAVSKRQAAIAVRLARGQLVFWRLTGRYREAAESLQQVLSIAEGAPAAIRASALCDAGLVAAILGDHVTARAHLEQSLALFDGSDQAGAASARNILAMVSIFLDEPATALRRLEENLERARGARSEYTMAEALVALGTARMFRGDAEQAAEAFEECAEAARRAGDEALLAQGLVGTGSAALARAQFHEAATALEEGLGLARELGERYTEAVALTWLGELSRLRGDSVAARQRFEECRRLAIAIATPYPLARSLIGLGLLALDDGDLAAARNHLAEAVETTTGAGLTPLMPTALEAAAQVALAQPDGQAGTRFEEAREAAERAGDKATMAKCLSGLGATARRAGDLDRAWALQHQSLGMHHEIGDPVGAVAALEALAGLATRQAGPPVAARLFGAAESLRDEIGHPRGRLAQETYEADKAVLRKAMKAPELEAASAQGSSMSLADAVSYVSRGRGPRRQATLGWDGLTATEREVALLAAEGLTNAKIAERLVMSRETVKTHLTRIFSKLGVSSRRQVVQPPQKGTTATVGDVSRRERS
ncbi:MAG TPA: LuxR C-terminal-related transcriptional regulator [Acidimicrobiales bacterium]|nr:LuxR C-terminal-related transcriptional regulator [Acidimicrobiales bacterium]